MTDEQKHIVKALRCRRGRGREYYCDECNAIEFCKWRNEVEVVYMAAELIESLCAENEKLKSELNKAAGTRGDAQ